MAGNPEDKQLNPTSCCLPSAAWQPICTCQAAKVSLVQQIHLADVVLLQGIQSRHNSNSQKTQVQYTENQYSAGNGVKHPAQEVLHHCLHVPLRGALRLG